MITYTRTDSDNPHFQHLASLLEADLKIRDGEDHAVYAQLNKIDWIKHVIVVYENELPVGCGAIREYTAGSVEVKRMYVLPGRRGQGFATGILKNLEAWAIRLNYQKCVLETGDNQPEAITLYKKNGYRIVANFGQYANSAHSICFEKILGEAALE